MKYRKRPVIIDAEVYRRGLEDGWMVLLAGEQSPYEVLFESHNDANEFSDTGISTSYTTKRTRSLPMPFIKTLEGNHRITSSDYIIKGVKGERYPCKAEIFHMIYEEVL